MRADLRDRIVSLNPTELSELARRLDLIPLAARTRVVAGAPEFPPEELARRDFDAPREQTLEAAETLAAQCEESARPVSRVDLPNNIASLPGTDLDALLSVLLDRDPTNRVPEATPTPGIDWAGLEAALDEFDRFASIDRGLASGSWQKFTAAVSLAWPRTAALNPTELAHLGHLLLTGAVIAGVRPHEAGWRQREA